METEPCYRCHSTEVLNHDCPRTDELVLEVDDIKYYRPYLTCARQPMIIFRSDTKEDVRTHPGGALDQAAKATFAALFPEIARKYPELYGAWLRQDQPVNGTEKPSTPRKRPGGTVTRGHP